MSKLIIINPAAGSGLPHKQIEMLKNNLIAKNISFDLVFSQGQNHIYELCQKSGATYDEVIIAGGDGSVQEAIKGLQDSRINLSIIPSGTGNDLYRSLYPTHQNESIDAIIERFTEVPFQPLNVCNSNVGLFINVASMGLDAAIVQNSLGLRRYLHSSKTYLISALYTILFYRPRTYTLILDGQSQVLDAYLIAVGNGSFYGGGMAITPLARIGEDELDVCIVKKMNRFKLLKLLPSVYTGKHLQFDEVLYMKAKTVEILSSGQELLNLDGELSKSSHLKISSNHFTLFSR